LAEAVTREAAEVRRASASGGSRHRPPAGPSPLFVPGRLQLIQAKLESALQDSQEVVGSASVLLCLGFLKIAHHMNYATARVWLGIGGGSLDGDVGKLASVHWSLTNLIVQLQALRQERASRQEVVYNFLRKHRISAPLSNRVKQYVKRSHARAREQEALALRRVSAELLLDVHDELRAPALSTHPLFSDLRQRHPHLVRELCRKALQPLLRSPGEVIFYAGDPCSRMYFVVSGQLQYTTYEIQAQRMLRTGEWLSEAALWTSWVHRGELRVVVSDCLLFALDASGFARVVSSHKAAHVTAAAYARSFVEGLNKGPQTDLSDPASVD